MKSTYRTLEEAIQSTLSPKVLQESNIRLKKGGVSVDVSKMTKVGKRAFGELGDIYESSINPAEGAFVDLYIADPDDDYVHVQLTNLTVKNLVKLLASKEKVKEEA